MARDTDHSSHPVHRVHRVGAGLLGAGLVVFAVLGLANRPAFFSRDDQQVMSMGSNGALAVISLVVGAVLLVAAARGGRPSSTTTLVVGALFLLSGFVHLALLDTAANLLGFDLANVFFSLGAGLLLLTLGAYGRVSGGLPPDSPYLRVGAPGEYVERPGHDELTRAEQAAASTRATPEQQALLHGRAARRADDDHDRAWRTYAANHTDAETDHLRTVADAESVLGGPPETERRPR